MQKLSNENNSQMSKLIKNLREKEPTEIAVQIEDELNKVSSMQGALKQFICKQEIVDFTKNNSQQNTAKLLEERNKLFDICNKAHKSHIEIIKEICPMNEENESKIRQFLPPGMRPLLENVDKYLKIGEIKIGKTENQEISKISISADKINELDNKIKSWAF